MAFLDGGGVTYLWSKIKEYVTDLLKGKADKVRGIEFVYGTQTGATGTWTGVTADDELYDGKQILYYLPFAGSGNATLNLTLADGTKTGAKNVYFQATTRMTTHYGAYQQFVLVYHRALNINGTNYEGWWSEPGRDTDTTNRINVNDGYKAKTALYRYQILLTYDSEYLLPTNAVNGSTATTKELTTIDFDIFGPIYYYYSTKIVAAEGSIGTAKYTAYSGVDLRYAFNLTTSSLTVGKAVYLVVEPMSEDGSRGKLHSTPIVQDLPESEDGLVYILLGAAYNGYCIYLLSEHARYWYKDGQLRAYTNAKDFSEDISDLQSLLGETKRASGNPATFYTEKPNGNFAKLLATLDSQTGLTGITIRNSASASVVNLFKPVSGTSNGVTFTPGSDGTIHIGGTFTAASWTYAASAISSLADLGLAAGDSVTVYSSLYTAVEWYPATGNSRLSYVTSNGTFRTVTIPANATRYRLLVYASRTLPTAGASVDETSSCLLAKGTASEWVPCADEYAVEFPAAAGTVYTGTVDLVNGELTDGGGTTYSLTVPQIKARTGTNSLSVNDGATIDLVYTAGLAEEVAAIQQTMPIIKMGTAEPTTAILNPGEIYLKLQS